MDMSQRGMWLPICRRNWRDKRSRECSQRFNGVGGTNDVVSGAASGDRGTGMLESTANGDGELEGTKHEFSALDIYFESVNFLLDWDEIER